MPPSKNRTHEDRKTEGRRIAPGSRRLPTGTATFLFTDIEGSTRLLNELGAEFDGILNQHAEIIREALRRHGGVEVNTEGDSFFAAFESASAAASAAAEAQRQLHEREWPRPLRVRMGMHTGEARLAGRDYIGMDVNRAARISAAANGGQVLISEATQRLLERGLTASIRLRDLGVHRLKDVPSPEHLYQLVIHGLPADFPPPRTLELTPTNLPKQLTAFFGRRRELEETERLISDGRLVTLTGPGGSGKTRLALQLARDITSAFPDGIFFVPLASLREPELVLPAIAKTYGLSEGEGLRRRLIDEIGQKQQLLLLDNFEHLASAAPEVAELLAGTSRLKILVTSRGRLHVYGEREYPVPPLAVPDLDRLPAVSELARSEAIALFVDRARAARSDFELTEENAATVAQICRRLEGLPLALELAAARVKLLSLDALLARLSDRLSVLGGTGEGSDRQRTLRGTIQWSYELLSPEERALFTRLGVFLGGAHLPIITTVLEADDDLALIDQLGSLIDKSLLRRVDGDIDLRVDMLETIREFALDRLEARGEADEYQERHARAYAALVEEAAPNLVGEEGGHWLDRVEREHDNLRAALTWSTSSGRPEHGLRIVAACWRYWQMRGHLSEGRDRAEAIVGMTTGQEDPALLAAALEAAGGLAYWQGEFVAARRRYGEWLELERRRGDERGIAEALYNLCFTYFVSRDDPEQGRRLANEALEIYRRRDDQPGIAKTLWALGGIEVSSEHMRTEPARAYFGEARDLFTQLGNRPMLAWTYFMGGGLETRAANIEGARHLLKSALRLFVELGDVSGYALALNGLGLLEWAEGRRESAARLAAASDRLSRTSGVNLSTWTTETWMGEFDPEQIKADPSLRQAWAQGESLETDAAVEAALNAGG
jgi:predicted ATPase/class 3 adenylate cyclase